MNCRLAPTPMITPALTNKPARFPVEKPLKISPAPRRRTPANAVVLAPTARMIRAFMRARNAMKLHVKLPTKLKVAALLKFSATRAA
jgi:hypothetical protein